MGENFRVDREALVGCRLLDVRPAHGSSGLFEISSHTFCTGASRHFDVGIARQGFVGHETGRAPRLPYGYPGFSPVSAARRRLVESSARRLDVSSPRGSPT
jgi:hypothetical protein